MIWILMIVLTVFSYPSTIKLLTIEQPYSNSIIISNLTLNLVLLICVIGAFSPWLTKKIFPKAPRWVFIFVAVALSVLIILVLKALGTPTKF